MTDFISAEQMAVYRRTALARERIGFEAQIDLEEGLRRLVAWWRSQKNEVSA